MAGKEPMLTVDDQGVRHRVAVAITGAGASPEAISLSDLAEVLTGLDKTLFSYLSAEGVEIPSGAKVSLVSIERGSERLVLTMDQPYLFAMAGVTRAVAHRAFEDLSTETRRELRSLSHSVASHGWALEFEADERLGIEAARLEPETLPAPRVPSRLEGTTTLHARCLRVGGVEPKAELRLTSGGLLYANLSEADAKALAMRLYEEVVLEGHATWDAQTWEIEEFRILGVSPYQPTDPVLAFKELAESTRGRWDDVDAVEYVRKLRDEN